MLDQSCRLTLESLPLIGTAVGCVLHLDDLCRVKKIAAQLDDDEDGEPILVLTVSIDLSGLDPLGPDAGRQFRSVREEMLERVHQTGLDVRSYIRFVNP